MRQAGLPEGHATCRLDWTTWWRPRRRSATWTAKPAGSLCGASISRTSPASVSRPCAALYVAGGLPGPRRRGARRGVARRRAHAGFRDRRCRCSTALRRPFARRGSAPAAERAARRRADAASRACGRGRSGVRRHGNAAAARGSEPSRPIRPPAHAADFLAMVRGEPPTPAAMRARSTTYLVTVADHGMNASTFTARVVASTRAGLLSAVVGGARRAEGPAARRRARPGARHARRDRRARARRAVARAASSRAASASWASATASTACAIRAPRC